MDAVMSEKAYKGMGMEGLVAKWYASLTHKSLDEFKALARRVAKELSPGSRILEVAPGPGYFAIELAKVGSYQVTGLDISRSFIEIARRNAENARVSVDFQQGDAAAMPFPNESFDFLLLPGRLQEFHAASKRAPGDASGSQTRRSCRHYRLTQRRIPRRHQRSGG